MARRHKKNSTIKRAILLLTIVVMLFAVLYIQAFYTIPNELFIISGKDCSFHFKSPVLIGLMSDKPTDLKLNGTPVIPKATKLNLMLPLTIRSDTANKIELKLKLFGIIPFKTVMVEVMPDKSVIPCGNTVGVKIHTDGVLIVATSQIYGQNGEIYEPYNEAGIRSGDYIIEVNGKRTVSTQDIISIMESGKGETLNIKLNRNGTYIATTITPILSDDGKHRLGLWLRDSTAGIGTLTFYDPQTKAFGALGHGIADVDVGQLLTVDKGEILGSSIVSVKKGRKGSPGELRGIFVENSNSTGVILKNAQCGIFGMIPDKRNIVPGNKAIPIGLRSQVKEGPAHIISNVSGRGTETYNIEIQKVFRNSTNSSKSMVIKITDQRLINYTGGIVQGMSGSPIIQDGRLVGAVTHVLVNDPTRGYGVFIEWMIQHINNISGIKSHRMAG